jgi:hypothetical protein
MSKKLIFGAIALIVVVGLAASIGLYFGNKTINTTIEKTVGAVGDSMPYLVRNNDSTYFVHGSFINGSTTIVSVLNPFGATATTTVDLTRLHITGPATSTFTVVCGAASTAYSDTSYNLLSSGSIATSTDETYIENNISASYGAAITGGSVAKIMLDPTYPYLVCKVTTAYSGAFTEATNTFVGTYWLRFMRGIE